MEGFENGGGSCAKAQRLDHVGDGAAVKHLKHEGT